MTKKTRSWKFWIIFWSVAAIFLGCWFLFLQFKNHKITGLLSFVRPVVQMTPMDQTRKREILTVFDIIPEITAGDEERTFLILFQNNMEIRPGGGFIGSFGILKTKGERVTFIDTHDTGVYDSGLESKVQPPYPMGEMLHVKDWEFRDSNWSPDFPTNAEKAEYFYHLEGGKEDIDGVVAISTELLTTFLKVTGPVEVSGYPGEYNSENAITKLEYQVEKGYAEQGIEKGKRKYIMKDLSKVLIDKAQSLSWGEKKKLIEEVEKHLNQKDIMVYFKDPELENKIQKLGWTGEVKNPAGDYLMIVDANLGSLKTDLYIKRSFDYTVDLRGQKPKATLKITYKHTARTKDWMTSNYNPYLRVYAPDGSWLSDATGVGEKSYGTELGKKFFGFIVSVPIGQTNTVEMHYDLPASVNTENYTLLIQKQSGVGTVPGKVTIISKDGKSKSVDIQLSRDMILELN